MSQKMNALTQPEIFHHGSGAHGAKVIGFVQMQSRREVEVTVITAIMPVEGVGYEVHTAVSYATATQWYKKPVETCFTLREALKRAYGVTRKHYAVTASRAFAGLLHDSIVPATDDIDC